MKVPFSMTKPVNLLDNTRSLSLLYLLQTHIQTYIVPSENNSELIFCSSFGYSLASVDFNGDGFKDLVVGAPFYASQGAAYIFMNTKDKGMHGLYSGPPEYIGTWGPVFWNFDSILLIIHLNNKISLNFQNLSHVPTNIFDIPTVLSIPYNEQKSILEEHSHNYF